ncbi:MAG TPA: hypothetical protein VFT50_11070 [Baekduia sp.]|nr:hypothetical protein [Baekduia sp.]
MQRTLFIALVALTALAGPLAAAEARGRGRGHHRAHLVARSGKPPLAARLVACTTGAEPTARAATFEGSMPAIAGSDRLEMRFTLLQRRGTRGRFRPVEVPDWTVPERSEPGRPGFVFTKRIGRLLAPAAYRARITFTWYDEAGDVVRRARRTTSTCLQADPRPNVYVGRVTGTPTSRGRATYAVAVLNDGGSTAPPFGVHLAIGDTTLGPVSVGPLASGTRELATFAGPACAPGSSVVVTLDAAAVMEQAREDDDVARRPCPLTR